MTTMDVYLTRAAQTHFRALASFSSYPDGFLIGHKRGQRYFVESVFSVPIRVASAQAKHITLDQLLDERILGFFTFLPNNIKRERLFRPLFMGKVLLEVQASSGKDPDMKAYSIDYADRFFLSPLKIKRESTRQGNA
ncbi:MAG: hypothetical protein GQ544_01525 [Candidatus Aminicenantes bacterium]|nr:hypothetical protein [Candidatus Aminicenantes bacterium]